MKAFYRQMLINKGGKDLDFNKILRVMDEAHIPKDISALLQDGFDIPKDLAYDLCQDLRCKTSDIVEHSVGENDQPGLIQSDESSTDDSAADAP